MRLNLMAFGTVLNAIKLSTWPCGARGSAGVERKAASRHDDGS
jgi:hypothetical protein